MHSNTKTQILRILRKSNGYISGQEICESLNISRTAVWKVMNQLKEDGYVIEAVPNKGYYIKEYPDNISAEEIMSRMQTKVIAKKVIYFLEVDSTNNQAKIIADQADSHGTLLISEQQKTGRGRRGRNWSSPAGTGIWMSLILKPNINPANASMLTLVTALAVVSGIVEVTNLDARIKWPNDVVVSGKKVCGILTEMSSELDFINHLVIGIGINANNKEFPEDIKGVATSLSIQCGHVISRQDLVAEIMKRFEEYYHIFLQTEDLSGLEDEYNKILVHRNLPIKIQNAGETTEVYALGIDNMGRLLVKDSNNEIVPILSGEVSVRGISGYV